MIKIHIIPCFKNRFVRLFGVSVLLIKLDLVYFRMPQTNLVC